jgi:transposase
MARRRRNYTREFKVEAVKLVTQKGYSVAEAARSLGIGENLLRNWKQALEQQGDQAFPGNGKLTAIEEELRQLKAENKRLQMERDILKKAMPASLTGDIFSQDLLDTSGGRGGSAAGGPGRGAGGPARHAASASQPGWGPAPRR